MKKVLFVTYRFPLPLHEGGRIRMWDSAERLAKKAVVDLVSFIDKQPSDEDLKKAKTIFRNIKLFYMPKLSSYLNATSYLFSRLPLQVGYFFNREMDKYISKRSSEYDETFGVTIRTAPYLFASKSKKRTLDFVDAMSLSYSFASEHSTNPIWKQIYSIEIPRLKEYERRCAETFDRVEIISKRDAKYIETFVKRRIAIVPLTMKKMEETKTRVARKKLLFFGKMDYMPNYEAAVKFSQEVFPGIRETTNATFVIAGKNSEKLKFLEKIDGIEVLGFCEDLDAVISSAKLVVVPVFFGAGLQTKILHALSLNKPVITTEFSAMAFEKDTRRRLIVCKDLNEMKRKIIKILSR